MGEYGEHLLGNLLGKREEPGSYSTSRNQRSVLTQAWRATSLVSGRRIQASHLTIPESVSTLANTGRLLHKHHRIAWPNAPGYLLTEIGSYTNLYLNSDSSTDSDTVNTRGRNRLLHAAPDAL